VCALNALFFVSLSSHPHPMIRKQYSLSQVLVHNP
jgi:hypothetical protein